MRSQQSFPSWKDSRSKCRAARMLSIQRLAKRDWILLQQTGFVGRSKKKTCSFSICCHLDKACFLRVSCQASTDQITFSSCWAAPCFLPDFSFQLSGKLGKDSRNETERGERSLTRCCEISYIKKLSYIHFWQFFSRNKKSIVMGCAYAISMAEITFTFWKAQGIFCCFRHSRCWVA